MKTEIRQNGKVILSSTDDISIPMIFKNLCGKNFWKRLSKLSQNSLSGYWCYDGGD